MGRGTGREEGEPLDRDVVRGVLPLLRSWSRVSCGTRTGSPRDCPRCARTEARLATRRDTALAFHLWLISELVPTIPFPPDSLGRASLS